MPSAATSGWSLSSPHSRHMRPFAANWCTHDFQRFRYEALSSSRSYLGLDMIQTGRLSFSVEFCLMESNPGSSMVPRTSEPPGFKGWCS
jgi:hypothetical protein